MIEDTIAVGIPVWKKMIEDAGGQWVGVQMPIFGDGGDGDRDPVVLFLTPFSSNPVYLSIYQITEDNVKQKLGIPTVSKRTRINFTQLKERMEQIAATLRDIAYQIDEELKNAEK
jgi:hypothetical protein